MILELYMDDEEVATLEAKEATLSLKMAKSREAKTISTPLFVPLYISLLRK
jgi:hypothetical protein